MKDWDSAYKIGETPWDKGYASPPIAEYLSENNVCGSVLVPGCGAGHDVRLLAEAGADVVGFDIAPTALAIADSFPKSGNEKYLLGDFLNLPKNLYSQFDFVVEHTCLCALDPNQRSVYVDSVIHALKPGGHLLAVFFCKVSNYSGGGPPHPISPTEIDALFADQLTFVERSIPRQTYPERPVGSEQLCLLRKS
ncbi:MAG: methyltransferase domain-containing protein [Coraliomargaritaceae bacterium]